jgi:hypothetical protein
MFINLLTNSQKQLIIKPSRAESKVLAINANYRESRINKLDGQANKESIVFCISITKYDTTTITDKINNQLLTHN